LRAGTPGAFGRIAAKAAEKRTLVRESQRQALEISARHRLEVSYRKFYASLSPEDRAFARQNGIHKPACDTRQRTADRKNGLEFCDPADLPHAVGTGAQNGRKLVNKGDHPVDSIEPQNLSVEVQGLTRESVIQLAEVFSDCLRWALDIDDLITRGKRTIALIHTLRPDLGAGLPNFPDRPPFVIFGGSVGQIFGRYLEWLRRGTNIAEFGERLEMTAYFLRPDLLTQNTLAKLGLVLNKTRQAKDKLANCARDTFAGHKALAMRPDITRDRCRAAQLGQDVRSQRSEVRT
jgi:hypothetical protein